MLLLAFLDEASFYFPKVTSSDFYIGQGHGSGISIFNAWVVLLSDNQISLCEWWDTCGQYLAVQGLYCCNECILG